ncbi:alpha-mannosidase [Acetatifactor aquisgranensis]|uniref:alpha-mannosidase n=1 Tax=Acetatifactor aquisgranensis TaxID=2941233 RepID=UPI00203D723B|nr:glycoside hydrolase family 38 C-terminal domain-containing protein [Acetatifactor aquisgranensis]
MDNRTIYPGRQWNDRLAICARELPEHYFSRVQALEAAGFTTTDRLSLEEAVQRGKRDAKPMKPGTAWGGNWEYGWFFINWTVPEALAGERLIFLPGVGEEMLVWVDGMPGGAVDKKHGYVTAAKNAAAGQKIEIVMECYAGHGPRLEDGGYCQEGKLLFDETDEPQQMIRPSFGAVWQEDVFQAAMDYLTLYSLLSRLPQRSLRAMKVTEGLKRFVTAVDLELPEKELIRSVKEAGRVLKPLLAAVNGSTAPEFVIFGQSHLDLAWLWTVEETRRKAARTYSNQLALMEDYPEYRFFLCEPPILEYLKESYPEIWERVKGKVHSGQIIPEGAVYVECDTNMPCGESLVRQFLYGREWFEREFGKDCKLAWIPDTFGFSGALPQIMKQCGVEYFASQKLIRQDPECEPFPYNDFWWQGIDGSRVLTHFFKDYNAAFSPADMIRRWEDDRIQCEGMDGMIYPFGYGDGGGGPTRELLETVRRCADLEGAPRTRYADPVSYFEKVRERGTENVFTGEIYLAWHRGTYTAQAKTKRGVRRAEIMLKEAEYWDTVRALYAGSDTGRERLKELWKRLLFQQFHDVLPGTGIARVHREAERELEDIYIEGERILQESFSSLEESLPFPREKSCGKAQEASAGADSCRAGRREDGNYFLSGSRLQARLDGSGRVVSLVLDGEEFADKEHPMNNLRLYRNINGYYDAWEIGSMYEQEEDTVAAQEWETEQILYQGKEALRLTGKLRNSPFTQTICLSEDGLALEFHMRIDWQERHRMLKVDFPSAVRSGHVTGEIAFGACSRPATASYQWEKDRYEVSGHRYSLLENGKYGMALLNDSKYGYSAKEDRISLTLLRSPLKPDQHADQGIQEFSYSCYPFQGDRIQAQVVQRGISFNRRAHLRAETLAAESALAERTGLFRLTAQAESCHVVTEAVKLSEDGKGNAVIRLYEACGVPQKVLFTPLFPIRELEETSLLEKDGKRLDMEEGSVLLSFRPFEIKTIIMEVK